MSFASELKEARRNCKDPDRGGSLTFERFAELIELELPDTPGYPAKNTVNNWEREDAANPPGNKREVQIAIVTVLLRHGGLAALEEASRLLALGGYATLSAEESERLGRLLALVGPPPPPPTPPEVPRREGVNPFVTGTIKLPERFYGRKDELNDIRSSIGGTEPACVSVIGTKYSGKSSLLFFVRERIKDLCAQEQKPVVVYVNLKSRLSRNVRGLVEILHQGIKEQTGLEFWKLAQSSEDWPFQIGLEQLYNSGYRLIVLLDEFDSISHRLMLFGSRILGIFCLQN